MLRMQRDQSREERQKNSRQPSCRHAWNYSCSGKPFSIPHFRNVRKKGLSYRRAKEKVPRVGQTRGTSLIEDRCYCTLIVMVLLLRSNWLVAYSV